MKLKTHLILSKIKQKQLQKWLMIQKRTLRQVLTVIKMIFHVVPVIATRWQNGALPRIVALAKRQSDIALIGVDLFYPDCPHRSLFVFIVHN